MADGPETMLFLTQHCGTTQLTVCSLTFSPTLCLCRSYTIFVLSHSCLLWPCLTSFPHYLLSPPLSLSALLFHLSLTYLSLPHFHRCPYSSVPSIFQAAVRLQICSSYLRVKYLLYISYLRADQGGTGRSVMKTFVHFDSPQLDCGFVTSFFLGYKTFNRCRRPLKGMTCFTCYHECAFSLFLSCLLSPIHSPLLHAFLQSWQQELLMEAVDRADVGEDTHHHLAGERASCSCLLHQPPAEHLVQEVKPGHVRLLRVEELVGDVKHTLLH